MRAATIAIATFAALAAGTAQAIEVHRMASVEAAPDAVWAEIGGFCAIKDWHPAVENCEESQEGGVTFRTLTLTDGGTIKEKLVEQTETSYTYEIVESPLPVQNYRSTISVMPEGDGTMVDWRGTFDAKGVSDADAEATIAGIYKAGLDKIAGMSGN
jgi:hypothetical protein